MTTRVSATWTDGIFKPDQSLPLADQTRVRLTVEPIPEKLDPVQAWEDLKTWIRDNPLHGLGRHLTRDELHERR